jgi:hypothetical protein
LFWFWQVFCPIVLAWLLPPGYASKLQVIGALRCLYESAWR